MPKPIYPPGMECNFAADEGELVARQRAAKWRAQMSQWAQDYWKGLGYAVVDQKDLEDLVRLLLRAHEEGQRAALEVLEELGKRI